jgi:hypothetical protein
MTNSSQATLPSLASPDRKNRIRLISYWTKDGAQVGKSVDTTLPYDFLPGESAILPLTISAPKAAAEYTLRVQLSAEVGPTIPPIGNKSLEFKVQVIQ